MQRSAQVRHGDLPPGPRRRGAERRRRLVEVGIDAAQHRQHGAHHERHGDERLADRHEPPRRPPVDGRVSNVMSMPKPIVTADVAIGSISPVSSSRPARRRGDGQGGEPADHDGDDVADGGRAQRAPIDATGSMPRRMPGRTSARPRCARPRATSRRARSERSTRAPGARRRRRRWRRRHRDEARWRPVGAAPAGQRARASARLWRRCCQADQATPSPMTTSCSTASVAAAPMSPSWVARRQISTSIVERAGVAEDADHAERREREHEDDRRGGQDRRAQQRQRDLAERPPRRGAERRRGRLQVARAGAPTRRRRCARRRPG